MKKQIEKIVKDEKKNSYFVSMADDHILSIHWRVFQEIWVISNHELDRTFWLGGGGDWLLDSNLKNKKAGKIR